MPRISPDYNQPYAHDIAFRAHIKKNIPDVLPDLKHIYELQLKRFYDFLYPDTVESLEEQIEYLSSLKVPLTTQNRIYIVTNLNYIPFVLVNMDDAVVQNLINLYNIQDIKSPADINPSFISTLFIFSGKDLLYRSDIYPHDVAQLTAVFNKENLYNFSSTRYDLYGRPRRTANSVKK